jgi:hypothetical protein
MLKGIESRRDTGARLAFTTESVRSKLYRARRKVDDGSPSLGLLHTVHNTDMSTLIISGGRQFGGRLRTGNSRLNSSAACHFTLLSLMRGLRFDFPRQVGAWVPEKVGPGLSG